MKRIFFSLKWKLTLALVVLAMGLVGLYVTMAKSTFESDKISYVFDSQQAQVGFIAREIKQKLERTTFEGRAILSSYDFEKHALSETGQHLFQDEGSLVSAKLVDLDKKTEIAFLTKTEVRDLVPAADAQENTSLRPGEIEFFGLKDSQYSIKSIYKDGGTGRLALTLISKFEHLMPELSQTTLVLIASGQKIAGSGADLPFGDALQDIQREKAESTSVKSIGREKYLVSSAPILGTNLKVAAFTSERVALGALGVLYERSLVFILFSAFATALIAVLLSSGLTRSLVVLTADAVRIGRGDFTPSSKPLSTNDEIGLLSTSFATMSTEIQRLLLNTKEKTRMEEELKTAKLVQDSLFPSSPNFRIGEFDIASRTVSSTECGGDWWYYFVRGDHLFIVIADATGHGTPAALITSAARSIFSQLQESEADLPEMAKAWDKAVKSCSNGRVFMTAFLLKLDLKTGEILTLNASHEQALTFTKNGDDFEPGFTDSPVNSTLGETSQTDWKTGSTQIHPGDVWVIITDGLPGIKNTEDAELGEGRLKRAVKKIIRKDASSSESIAQELFQFTEDFRTTAAYPDDVTYVILKRDEA